MQTRAVLFVPLLVVIFTRCKFGLNCRRVIPVTLVPTPPRYLALPRVSTELPTWEPLPHISQTRAIALHEVGVTTAMLSTNKQQPLAVGRPSWSKVERVAGFDMPSIGSVGCCNINLIIRVVTDPLSIG